MEYLWAQDPEGGVHRLEPLCEVLHKHVYLNYSKIFSLTSSM